MRKKRRQKGSLVRLLFPEYMERVDRGRCPFCGEVVNLGDFRDPLSVKEFKISGLCQKCQDEVFG